MSMSASTVERVAYGRPLDPSRDREMTDVRLVPRSTTAFVGRFFLAAIFLVSGFAKLTDSTGTVAHMTAAGVPAASTLVWIAGVAEVLGGLSLATGLLARVGALGLIAFTALATWYFHAFWNLEGAERLPQMVNFMKNLAIVGGLLLLVAHGPGRYSLDYRLRKPLPA
jgi:putative oxidoreductase